VVPDTLAFEWSRTAPDAAMLAALQDPQWQPYLVFPGEFVEPSRVISALPPAEIQHSSGKRPLFILLMPPGRKHAKSLRKVRI
jgi:DTW domain-containing protein YfiP